MFSAFLLNALAELGEGMCNQKRGGKVHLKFLKSLHLPRKYLLQLNTPLPSVELKKDPRPLSSFFRRNGNPPAFFLGNYFGTDVFLETLPEP